MSNANPMPARLTSSRKENGVLRVEIAGDWLDRSSLPGIAAVAGELSGDTTQALEFETSALAGWDSALLVRILAVSDLCTKAKIEFRASTLPAGLAKLIGLAAGRAGEDGRRPQGRRSPRSFSGLASRAWRLGTGGAAMLSFMGESVVASLKLVRGQAQFRWSDTLMVMQQCGPEALGIVAAHQLPHRHDPRLRRRHRVDPVRRVHLHGGSRGHCHRPRDGLHHDRHHHVRPHRRGVCRAIGHHEGEPGN